MYVEDRDFEDEERPQNGNDKPADTDERVMTDDERVDKESADSFPASDPPGW